MIIFVGIVLLFIGLISAVSLLISAYKEFKKDENKKTSNKVLFLVSVFLESISPSSLSGFAFLLSIVAIVIGIALLKLFH
ncbi:hypothetical protein [Neobacillus soli]|uniref:hypothetical protein n=1 Tax=Neobacillus soli TaxID=220688 RepID=UPI0008258F04|nr:hypothetical protein [Neobacillus soli]